VPVAAEVAWALGAPLDVCTVRKLGAPGHEELAMGAIAPGGVRVLNEDILHWFAGARESLDQITAREEHELARREEAYRGRHPFPDLQDKTVLLVDDGLATGATMRAAIARVRACRAAWIVVVAPVGAPEICRRLAREADEVVCGLEAEDFEAVGDFYVDFSPTDDAEVCELLMHGIAASETSAHFKLAA
jgi:putative phosphoribosyl transferase